MADQRDDVRRQSEGARPSTDAARRGRADLARLDAASQDSRRLGSVAGRSWQAGRRDICTLRQRAEARLTSVQFSKACDCDVVEARREEGSRPGFSPAMKNFEFRMKNSEVDSIFTRISKFFIQFP